MYCPRCSHEQDLEKRRFCSRCGFPMTGVAMLIENSGIIPQVSDTHQPPNRRRRLIRDSLLLTLAAWQIVLLSSFLWNTGGQFEGIVKLIALVSFILGLAGLLRFAYAFLFVDDTVQPDTKPAPEASYVGTMPENRTPGSLPSPQSVPVSDYIPRSQTREIVSQPSVTEHTTRLLDDQRES
jgi:hypothetical protein